MSRTSKLMLGAGFVLVVAMYLGLVWASRGGPEAPTGAVRPAEVATAPKTAQESEGSAPPPVAAAPAAPAAPSAGKPSWLATSTPRPPSLAVPAGALGRELKRDADGNLVPMFSGTELRDQIHMTDAAVAACAQQAGAGVTGKATLAFTVAASGGKLVIESTSVEDAGTLVGNPALLDCLHRTASAFAPLLAGRPVPELGTPIYVRRHVRLDAGAVAENAYFNFSYNP